MKIRMEQESDYGIIYELVKTAFETAEVSRGNEQDNMLEHRNNGRSVPELCLVAEENGEIIGQIMFSKLTVCGEDSITNALLLAPVSVRVESRGMGVGSTLVKYGLDRARHMGYAAVFLRGNPLFYKRFGFIPLYHYGLDCNSEVAEEAKDYIMAMELVPGALGKPHGTAHR